MPAIVFGIIFKDGLRLNAMVLEHLAYVVLFLGFQMIFFALQAVVMCFVEVGNQFAAHGYGFLMGQVVEQPLDAPGYAYLL